MPLDLAEATYLSPQMTDYMSTSDLISMRARQLEKRTEDLENMRQLVWKSRQESAKQFTKRFEHSIRKYDFEPGRLVLVKNSQVSTDLSRKWKPKYLGPFVVVGRTGGGGYTLAELDGTVSKLRIAEKRVIPYYLRTTALVPLEEEGLDMGGEQDTVAAGSDDDGEEEDGYGYWGEE
jgi:hypothetical protein